MMPPREKVQVGLVFLGLILVGFGIALTRPGARKEEGTMTMRSQGIGFWKDQSLNLDSGRKIGPWMIGTGVATFVAAYLTRER